MLLPAFSLAVLIAHQPGPNQPTRPVSPILQALDLNHDGILSADEIALASSSLLKLDKNGDGQLTPDEYRPPRPDGQAHPALPQTSKGTAPASKRLERPRPLLDTTLDEDGDEVISAKEIAKAPALLKKLDLNGDGRLTPDEYEQKPSEERERPSRSRD